MMKNTSYEHGYALLLALAFMAVLTILAAAAAQFLVGTYRADRMQMRRLQQQADKIHQAGCPSRIERKK